MPSPLLNSADAADALNVDRSTLSRMVKAGRIRPAVRGDGLRGAMFFYPSEVEKARARMATPAAVESPRKTPAAGGSTSRRGA